MLNFEAIARRHAHAIDPVDLGSAAGIRQIVAAMREVACGEICEARLVHVVMLAPVEIAEERERCAKIAESMARLTGMIHRPV